MATDTPIGAGVSILYEDSITVSASVSVSMMAVSVTVISQTVGVTYTISEWVVVDAVSSESLQHTVVALATAQEVVVISASFVQVQLPVYVSRIVQVSRIIRITSASPPAGSGISAGTLIGSVSGAGVVIALIVAAVVFVVRSKNAHVGSGYDGESTSTMEDIMPSGREPIPQDQTEADQSLEVLAQSLHIFGGEMSDDGLTSSGQDVMSLYV
jgi:hypothetical protein